MKAVWVWILMAVSFGLQAQGYPAKSIRLIVPLAPGGNQDIVARAVAEEVSKVLGQQIVVENRPGSSAIVGTQSVKASAPDGYTLLSVSNTFARVPGIVKAAGYDAAADFTGVSLVSRIPMVLVVNPGNPARTLQDLVALAKDKPGSISYGTSGVASTGHVAGELLSRQSGIKLLHVPYKGNSQAIVDVLGGQITMMFDQVSTAVGHIRSGKLRALGVTTKARSALLPDVPTLHDTGAPGFDDVTWNGIVAPAGTPREIVAQLHAAVARALGNDEFRKRFLERGIDMVASASPAEFSAYVKSEAEDFVKLAREANIRAE